MFANAIDNDKYRITIYLYAGAIDRGPDFMELRQFRYFTAVAAELSFTKAAVRLNVSQPPLSQQIANLESELGARLFERTSRSVKLSEAGKALLPHVHAILQRIEEARVHVKRVAQGVEGRVNIGLSGSHFLGPFPEFIKHFRMARPAVDIVLHEMAPTQQLAALRNTRLDLSFERGMPPQKDLVGHLLWRDVTVVAMPLGHPLAARTSVRLAELKDEDFVSLRFGSSIFQSKVYSACLAEGFEPRVVQEVLEVPAVLNLVAAGLGISVVPGSLARLRADSVACCRLEMPQNLPPITADVYLMGRREEQSRVVIEFSEALHEWATSREAAIGHA
jgi:LysR family transcriptional regulator, benzoate and cis,cis-muconate-responsive activator of ben and cat genes